MKEADHDFAAFGQCAISTEVNTAGNGLLDRCWHLRDLAWFEDEEGAIGLCRSALSYLPSNNLDNPPLMSSGDEPFWRSEMLNSLVMDTRNPMMRWKRAL